MGATHNSDLPLRFGTRPRSAYGKFPFCHSFASANSVPVPNVPFRDSGSGNFGKSSSLCAIP
ncbi:hypothetical protein EHQ47_16665 [Leptospira bourretii]|nr:hypothetical protein EHQ47_16665 [Leptospira bourretii]